MSDEEWTQEDQDRLDELSERVGKMLDAQFAEAKEKGCSIEGCTEPVSGIGEGRPYCGRHFWQEFDKKYPE